MSQQGNACTVTEQEGNVEHPFQRPPLVSLLTRIVILLARHELMHPQHLSLANESSITHFNQHKMQFFQSRAAATRQASWLILAILACCIGSALLINRNFSGRLTPSDAGPAL